MEISVTGKKMDVGQAFSTYCSDNIKEQINKFYVHATDASVTMTKDGHHVITADVRIHAPKGIELRGTAHDSDPHIAFDTAMAKLINQVRRYKNRLNDHHKRSEKMEFSQMQYQVLDTSNKNDEDAKAPTVIAEMMTDVPTLSVDEAVMRLDLSDAPALIFNNITHGGINMVYRRTDGNVGWADPRGEKRTTMLSA